MKQKDFISVITTIRDAIKGSMYENHVYCVGGSVRDFYLVRDIKDIDLVVDLKNGAYSFGVFLRNALKIQKEPISFKRYGTVLINVDIPNVGLVPLEITSTRKDLRKKGMSVSIYSAEDVSIDEDSVTRDLTINSFYLNISSLKLYDPTKLGRDDMLNHVLRTTNSPKAIFEDDPLRMLRIVRLKSQLKWGIEKETFFGIVKYASLIKNMPKERIREEFNKILLSDRPSEGLNMLRYSQLLKFVCPPLYKMRDFPNDDDVHGDLYLHTLDTIDYTEPILEQRLAALFHDYGKLSVKKKGILGKLKFTSHETVAKTEIRNILFNMGYSYKVVDKVLFAIENHMKLHPFKTSLKDMSDKTVRRFMNLWDENANLVLGLINADNLANGVKLDQIKNFRIRMAELKKDNDKNGKIKLPINGNDIMKELSIKEGPEVSYYLSYAKMYYIDNPNVTADGLIEYLKTKKEELKKK